MTTEELPMDEGFTALPADEQAAWLAEQQPEPAPLDERIAAAAAAAVAAILPALAPQADAAAVVDLARTAALNAMDMQAATPPPPPIGSGTPG